MEENCTMTWQKKAVKLRNVDINKIEVEKQLRLF